MRTSKEIKAEMDKVQAAGRRMNNLQNEGHYGYDHADSKKLDALFAEFRAAKFAEEWSKEQTIEKRVRWNATVVAAKKIGKASNLHYLQTTSGIKMSELRDAVKFHNL
jgi:putative IMPACT (imprinted ancient) family translation regulator